MEGVGGGERSKCFLAMCNGVGFQMNDLVDVFVGTGKGVTGNKAFPTKARFKGVRVEKGEERFLCRPIVGSQKGRCPSFPPESCLKVKAFGSDVYGERKPRFFSKLTIEVQERLPLPAHSPLPPKPKPQKTPDLQETSTPTQRHLTPLHPTLASCFRQIGRSRCVQRKL